MSSANTRKPSPVRLVALAGEGFFGDTTMIAAPSRQRDHGTPTFPEPFLARLYPLPHPLVTLEEFLRFRHEDLADFSDEALAREYRRVRARADLDPDEASRAWLDGRLAAIDIE